ncbi:MAG: DNA translocase FtsK [Candidatus Methylacidiphilales bacterium]|nr:DNA translocase FtsK [Candidatus Methylacidiphilales bacterium]
MAQGNSISVSQLKCAVHDPAWREKFMAGQSPPTLSFAPSGSPVVFGQKFHAAADEIVAWLLRNAPSVWDSITRDADDLWPFVHDEFVGTFIEDTAAGGRPEEALAFADRVKTFCTRIVQLRQRRPHFETWQDVFLSSELSVHAALLRDNGYSVNLTGKIDAVRLNGLNALEIVDYKLTQGTQQMHDMVQLAIYSRMLEIARPGCQFAGVVEYYLPEFHELTIRRSELDSLFGDLVHPVLKQIFGVKPAGNTTVGAGGFDDAGASSAPASAQRSETEIIARQITDAYANHNLPVEVASVTDAPQIYRFHLRPGSGVKVTSLANRAEDLQVALALGQPPLIKASRGFVILDIPKPQARTVFLTDVIKSPEYSQAGGKVRFPVGVDIEGKPLLIDLTDPVTCHGLIAGGSGSGKSELLKSIVASLIARNTTASLRLAIVDPKILTFTGISGCPFLTQPVITEIQPAIAMLHSTVEQMDERYRLLAAEGQTSLKDRWDAGMTDIPYLVIIFDEFADLILADRAARREFEELVAILAAKGRAAGIHLLLATQRPDRTIVTGLIKANLLLKICLRVTTAINSQIVIDEPGAESLLGRGDLLCDAGRGLIRAQSCFIPQSQFLEACLLRKSAAQA